jgi:hypothetical protein
MKASRFPWLCLGLLTAVLPLAATEPLTSPGKPTEARIEKLLHELESPRYAERERAMKELRELGEKAVAPLKEALAAGRSAEFHRRARMLLEPFTPVKYRPLGLNVSLQERCARMRAMQIRVYDRTRILLHAIAANPDKKPSRSNTKEALAIADEESNIICEADQAIRALKVAGAAEAFQAVVTQVRDDMKTVQKRLWATDLGKLNQAYQMDIIEQLDEMVKALRKPGRR